MDYLPDDILELIFAQVDHSWRLRVLSQSVQRSVHPLCFVTKKELLRKQFDKMVPPSVACPRAAIVLASLTFIGPPTNGHPPRFYRIAKCISTPTSCVTWTCFASVVQSRQFRILVFHPVSNDSSCSNECCSVEERNSTPRVYRRSFAEETLYTVHVALEEVHICGW